MVLKKKSEVKFEEADTAEGQTDVKEAGESSTVDMPEAAAESTATAVAVKPAAAVAVAPLTSKLAGPLDSLENAIDPDSVDWNTFERVTVSLDGFEDSKRNSLGKVIKLDVMSWNHRWVASPGVQDAEATERVRYSNDGVKITGTGESMDDYIQMMIADGYSKASKKEYLTIYGFIMESDGKAVAPEDREIVALQVPPQSRAQFSKYQIEMGVKIMQGVARPSKELVCTQEKVKGKTTNYAQIKFSAK